jgi:orotate phosphoribosyltransferase
MENGISLRVAEETAAKLLEIGAVKLSPNKPFTWSSGWKSPIYCDNRLTLSYPAIRTFIKEQLAELIKQNYNGADAIAGVATAGIPQGALIAELLNLPFIYVRSKPKGHGMENMIEGKVTEGQKVVVVEDLISTGGSSLKAAEAIKESGMEVLGMVAIFTYGFKVAEDNFKAAETQLFCLSNYNILIDLALKNNYISEDKIESLKSWKEDPANWSV